MNIRRPIAFVATSAATVAVMSIAGLLATGTARGATTPPRCETARLAFAAVPDGAAAGSTYALLAFTNTGAACALYGYPGVAVAPSPAGLQTGHAATRNALVKPALVTLEPGQAAFALLSVTNVGNYPRKAHCDPGSTAVVRAYPPGATARLAALYAATVCANRHVHGLSVTAVTTDLTVLAALQSRTEKEEVSS